MDVRPPLRSGVWIVAASLVYWSAGAALARRLLVDLGGMPALGLGPSPHAFFVAGLLADVARIPTALAVFYGFAWLVAVSPWVLVPVAVALAALYDLGLAVLSGALPHTPAVWWAGRATAALLAGVAGLWAAHRATSRRAPPSSRAGIDISAGA